MKDLGVPLHPVLWVGAAFAVRRALGGALPLRYRR